MLYGKARRGALAVALVMTLLPVAAAHGLSTNNPRFATKSGALVEGEKLTIGAEASGSAKMQIGKDNVTCKTLKLVEEEKGVEHNFKGSAAPNPGTGVEKMSFGGCEVEGASGCTINGESGGSATIKTEPLKDTLVYKTKAAAENEEDSLLTLFEPEGKVFLRVKFSGTCPETGESATETKMLAENESGEALTEKHAFTFPTRPIKTYFRNVSGKTEEVKLPEPKGGGLILAAIFVIVLIYVIIVIWGLIR